MSLFFLLDLWIVFCISTYYLDLGVDIQDDMGRHEVGYVQDVVKSPVLADNGLTGCRFKASFTINKVYIVLY